MFDSDDDCNEDALYRILKPAEVQERLQSGDDLLLLDVRSLREYVCHRIPGSTLIPLTELGFRMRELELHRETICICEHGVRSEYAADLLAQNGFAKVSTMAGGMVRWQGEIEQGEVKKKPSQPDGRREGFGLF